MNPKTVTVHRVERDAHGDPLPFPSSHEIEDVDVAPRMSSESDAEGEQVIVGLTLFFPPGADVLPSDRVEVDGVKYDMDGEVGDWGRSPHTGWHPKLQAAASRST